MIFNNLRKLLKYLAIDHKIKTPDTYRMEEGCSQVRDRRVEEVVHFSGRKVAPVCKVCLEMQRHIVS